MIRALCFFSPKTLRMLEDALGVMSPYEGHHIVFVEESPVQLASFATLSLIRLEGNGEWNIGVAVNNAFFHVFRSTEEMHSDGIVEQAFALRKLMAEAISRQLFGHAVTAKDEYVEVDVLGLRCLLGSMNRLSRVLSQDLGVACRRPGAVLVDYLSRARHGSQRIPRPAL